ILVSTTTHGTLHLASNGGYTYDPNAGFVGTDVFRYKDSGQLVGSATVTITVTNGVPIAKPDAYAATTGVKLTVPAPGILANDTDPDGDPITAELVSGGGNGSLDLQPDGG